MTDLPGGVVALDANCFVHWLAALPPQAPPEAWRRQQFVSHLMAETESGRLTCVSSVYALAELSARAKDPARLQRALVTLGQLDFHWLDLDAETAREAAFVHRTYGLLLPAAIHIATARRHGAQALVTDDARLRAAADYLPVWLLDEAMPSGGAPS